jgi:hypothetical protein
MLHAEIHKVIESNPIGPVVAEIKFFSLSGSYLKVVDSLNTTPFCTGITDEEQSACIKMITQIDEDRTRA